MPVTKGGKPKPPKIPKSKRWNRGRHPRAVNHPSPPGKPSRGKHPKHPKGPPHPKHPKAPKHPSTTRGDLAHPVAGKHPGPTGGPVQSDPIDTTIGKPKHPADTLAGMHLHPSGGSGSSSAPARQTPRSTRTHPATKSFHKHKLGSPVGPAIGEGRDMGAMRTRFSTKSAKSTGHKGIHTGKAKKTSHTPSAVVHGRSGTPPAPKVSHATGHRRTGTAISRASGPFEEADASTYFGVNSPGPALGQPPSINPTSSRLL